jgi:site-specific recombinase XerD
MLISQKRLAKVKGKGKKERIVPIGSKSLDVIAGFINQNLRIKIHH